MTTPDLYIYLDEFERDDIFILSAAFVPADKAAQLLADWDALRLRIKEILFRDYPRAANHPKLQGHHLPEIHAVDLFQSKGYYRKYKHGTENNDPYWLQNYDWFEQSLSIIQKHNISFYPLIIEKSVAPRVADPFIGILKNLEFQGLRIPWTRVNRVVKNSYIDALPRMLISLETRLRALNLMGEVICDDHEMSKGFSVIDAIDWLRQDGHYTHLTAPRFASGLDESLLQVSDVLCYVAGRHIHAQSENIPLKPPLDSWLETYVAPLRATTVTLPKERIPHATAMVFDFLTEQIIRHKEVKAILKKNLRKIHNEFLVGE